VVVPTYGRAEALERCLAGVESQRPPADQVVVVYREEDEPTVRFLKSWVGADPGRREMVAVARPGVVPALLAGTSAVRGEVVVYLDDDAVPRPGWLQELRRGFTDPSVGAVGGRVVDHPGGREVTGWTRRVGELTWYGRLIGRHHLPTDRYGYVDWVTGGNRAFRLDLARHDHRLRHTARGRAMPNDVDASLAVGRLGWRVLYTPWAVVDHYPEAPRHGTLPTRVLEDEVEATAANHDYVLLKHLSGVGGVAFRAYGYLVGTSTLPGPARALAELPRSPRRSLAMARRILPAWRGRMEGARMHRAWRREGRSAR
jgi:glycosyltransferase involved in cell wall biosynthesis